MTKLNNEFVYQLENKLANQYELIYKNIHEVPTDYLDSFANGILYAMISNAVLEDLPYIKLPVTHVANDSDVPELSSEDGQTMLHVALFELEKRYINVDKVQLIDDLINRLNKTLPYNYIDNYGPVDGFVMYEKEDE